MKAQFESSAWMAELRSMTTRNISLRLEAYERLRRARKPGESFSDVVMRARWNDQAITAGELLSRRRSAGPRLPDDVLDRIEALKSADLPPAGKRRTD